VKKIFLACVLLVLFSLNLAVAQDILFQDAWVSPEAKLKDYSTVYINQIDTKEVKFNIFDVYERDDYSSDNQTPAEMRDEIELRLEKRLTEVMAKLMSVSKDKKAIAGKKAMLINLKISGTVNDEGLIDSFIERKVPQYTRIAFVCQIYDAGTNNKIISISDNYEKEITKEDVSSLEGSDIENWYYAMDVWADKIVAFLSEKRGL
jgi:hypothetical protein